MARCEKLSAFSRSSSAFCCLMESEYAEILRRDSSESGPFEAAAKRFSIRARMPMTSANMTGSVWFSLALRACARDASRSHSPTFFPALTAADSTTVNSALVSRVATDPVRLRSPMTLERSDEWEIPVWSPRKA